MAYQFASASSQYLTTASAPATAIPITMACRFNAVAGAVDGVLMALGATSGNFDRLVLTRNAALTIGAQSVAATVATSANSGSFTTGAWQHAGGVFQTANKRAFVNGAGGTAQTSAYSLTGLAQLTIGARRNSAGFGVFLSAGVAEVGIWTDALTDEEMASLAAGFTPDQIRPQSLVFYAPLIRTIQDLRGGLTITPTNSPTVAVHPRVFQ